MIRKLVLALVVAVAVTIGLLLLGAILVTLKVDIAITIGNFFKQWGSVIGILAGIWYMFSGSDWLSRKV